MRPECEKNNVGFFSILMASTGKQAGGHIYNNVIHQLPFLVRKM